MAVWIQTRKALPREASQPAVAPTPAGTPIAKRLAALIVEPKRASLHLATAVFVAALFGVPELEASLLLVAWVAFATLDVAFTAGWKRMMSGHGEDADFTPPPSSGVVMTGSISSTVRLDYDAGVAEKTYEPGAFVKGLYRLAFQAPFPYTSNLPAIEAARQRRTVIGLLTEYWYGENLVAPALDVRVDDDGKVTFVTELVRGTAPKDLPRAKALLADLTERFLDSGLPSWQVGSYNPRSIGNLIEREDGSFRIIDLESNLVTPILPPKAAVRAMSRGLYPSFDEIDTARLDAYLNSHRETIVAEMGEAGAAQLIAAARSYAEAQDAWHSAEPRLFSKLFKLAYRILDVPGWFRALGRLTAGSEQMAENFTAAGIATWQDEGRISDDEAEQIRRSLKLPEVASATTNLGAHMAMSVPLRFPLGSIARSAWVLGLRGKAEWAHFRGQGSAAAARQVHTLPVAVVAAVPGLGSFAYTLAKPLRQQRAIGAIALDQVFRHLSMSVYRGLHLDTLTLWMAKVPAAATRTPLAERLSRRAHGFTQTAPVAAAVLAANVALLAAAVTLDNASTTSDEIIRAGLIAQLFVAGAAGLLAFRSYWKREDRQTDLNESSGIFLWGAGGIFLIGLGVDYGLGVHDAVFGFTAAHLNVMPVVTDPSQHLIVLGYLTIAAPVLLLLRHELTATRASATWMLVAIAGTTLLVAGGSFEQLSVVQTPAQALTGAAVALAFASRLVETRRAERTADVPEAQAQLHHRNVLDADVCAQAMAVCM